jgi:hypothetical protein
MENFLFLPEKSLGIAIILRAIQDSIGAVALGNNPKLRAKARTYRIDALIWIFSAEEDRDNEPYSFSWWCEVLDLDKQSIRKFVIEGSIIKKDLNRSDEVNQWLKMLGEGTTIEYKIAL